MTRDWRPVLPQEAEAMAAARALGASWRAIARSFGRSQSTVRLAVSRDVQPASTGRTLARQPPGDARIRKRGASVAAMHSNSSDSDST